MRQTESVSVAQVFTLTAASSYAWRAVGHRWRASRPSTEPMPITGPTAKPVHNWYMFLLLFIDKSVLYIDIATLFLDKEGGAL